MINESFAERLQQAMNLRNLKSSQIEKLSEQLYKEGKIKKPIKMPLITDYLKGRYEAKQSNIYALSLILNVSEPWLMGANVSMEREIYSKYNNVFESNHILSVAEKGEEYSYDEKPQKSFPLLGKVRAGYNYLAQENIIGWITIDKKLADPENYFALKILGDSMQPILYTDDIVIVHRQPDVESGQVAIVLVDDEEGTIKKVVKYDDHIELVAFNSYYPPRRLDKSNKFKILGKVVEARISKIFE